MAIERVSLVKTGPKPVQSKSGISGGSDFRLVESAEIQRRIIMSIQSLEKQGKTHLAFIAPAPIAYINIDKGDEGVIHKFIGKKKVYRVDIGIPRTTAGDADKIKAAAADQWDKYVKNYLAGLNSSEIRTLVVDTGTEAWELLRLARLGKLTQVMPHHYGPVNAEFRELIRTAYDSDKNVIFIHKEKAEYINDKRTGKYERAGFSDMGFAVQVLLRTRWDSEERQFKVRVMDCRQNKMLEGNEYDGAELLPGWPCNEFAYLASEVFPGTSPEEWG